MDPDYFVHETAMVATGHIGKGTRIWAFCNVQADVTIGEDCNVGDHCFIERNVAIGDRVTVKNGVSLWDGVTVEDDVFIGPNAAFTNDLYPRSKAYLDEPVRTLLAKGCSIGANAVILAGHTIGPYAMIGAGAVVTKDVPAYTLWLGNPARQVGFVCSCSRRLDATTAQLDTITCECGETFEMTGNTIRPAK
jgi:acetyltransferase-like isoleucine patch superfamily enzyme